MNIPARKHCVSPYHKGPRWILANDFYIHSSGNTLQSWCKTCLRIHHRVYKGIKRRGKPYEKRKPRISREETNRRRRERYAKLTAKQRKDKRQYGREYASMRRRDNGIPVRNFRRESDIRIDITKFRELIPPYYFMLTRGDLEGMADRTKLSTETIYEILHYKRKQYVYFTSADSILTAIDLPHLATMLLDDEAA